MKCREWSYRVAPAELPVRADLRALANNTRPGDCIQRPDQSDWFVRGLKVSLIVQGPTGITSLAESDEAPSHLTFRGDNCVPDFHA